MRISFKSCITLAGVVVVASLGLTGRSAAQTTDGGTWGTALAAAAPAGVHPSSESLEAVSCTSAGNCTAIGSYVVSSAYYPFVATEDDGTWGAAATVIGADSTSVPGSIHISCAAPGDCAAIWSAGSDTYLIDESGGVWGDARAVTMGTTETELTGISCPAVGDCTAVGEYVDGSGLPFVMDSTNGTWDTPQEIPGVADLSSPSPLNADVTSVSCSSAGNCVAGGYFHFASNDYQPFLAVETGGSWGDAQPVAGVANLGGQMSAAGTAMVSCGSSGDCAATGSYRGSDDVDRIWVAYESGGTWSTATELPTPTSGSNASPESLSCSSRGYCAIAADYASSVTSEYMAFAATTAGGNTWTVSELPGVGTDESTVNGVSCSATGSCTVAGYNYSSPGTFFVNEVNGSWATAQGLSGLPTTWSVLTSLSCASPGYCTAVGNDIDGPLTVSEANPATITLHESASKVSYGDEQAETLTATVTSAAGGTPTGTVTITAGGAETDSASTDVCQIALANGTGTCSPSATLLRSDDTTDLVATYSGDAGYAAADVSATLDIATATTTSTVSLSRTSVTYGSKYQTEASVTVKPEFSGIPTGEVGVRLNGTLLCGVMLSSGKAECSVPDSLNAGRYAITTSYDGDVNFTASTSAASYLTVAKASSATTLTLAKATITRGHENSEKLTVKVSSPATGYATGKVTVKAGSGTVCVVTLKNGTGSCTLTASQLKAGSYKLTAGYAGDTNHASSGSSAKSLKVES